MHKRYPHSILLFFAWVTTVAAAPVSNATIDASASSRVSTVQGNGAAVTDLPAADAVARCEDVAARRHSELCAQWASADATRDAADWAGWTWFLGLGGILIGVGTLLAAIAAAVFAKRAADYTKAAADEARRSADAAETSVQPHVYFTDATVSIPLTRLSGLRVGLKNHGASTVHKLQFGYHQAFVQRPILDQADRLEVTEWDSLRPLGPQATTYISFHFSDFDEQELTQIRSGEAALVTLFEIRYEDSTGRTATDQTCLCVDQRALLSGDVSELNADVSSDDARFPPPSPPKPSSRQRRS